MALSPRATIAWSRARNAAAIAAVAHDEARALATAFYKDPVLMVARAKAGLDTPGSLGETHRVYEVFELLGSFVVTTTALFAIVLRDERRLSPERLACAWPPSSRSAALVVFGVLALPVYYARTRRSLVGFLLGLGLAIAVSALNGLLLGTIEWFLNPD